MSEAETKVVLVSIFFIKPERDDCFIHSCFLIVRADFDLSKQETADLFASEVVAQLAHHKPIHEWKIGNVSMRETDARELAFVLPEARQHIEVPEG